jgi:hypothetical protein
MAEMRITDGKGFNVTFDNGLAISVQIGRGNYCDNYHYPSYEISRENPLPSSRDAEIAVFSTDDAMIDIQSDCVKGYVPIEHVFRFIEFLRSLPSDLVKAEVELAVQPFDWQEAA